MKFAGVLVAVLAFAGARFATEAIIRPKGLGAKEAKASVDSGEIFESLAKQMEKNPRKAWGKSGEAKLRSFERTALIELQKNLGAIRSLGVSSRSFPNAEQPRLDFEGEFKTDDGVLPVKGQFSTLFFDSGATVILGCADFASYSDPASAYGLGLNEAVSLSLDNPTQQPSAYMKLEGWTRVPDGETDQKGGILLIRTGDDGELGMLVMIPQTPKELGDSLRAGGQDESLKSYVKSEIDKAAK